MPAQGCERARRGERFHVVAIQLWLGTRGRPTSANGRARARRDEALACRL